MKLMEYLPDNYRDSTEMKAIQQAIQPEIDSLWELRGDFLRQLDPMTATWGLNYWEKAFGLKVEPEKEPELRRSRIVAKIRGRGTSTVARIKSVAESFAHGEVDIVEIPEEDRLLIRLISVLGIPPNLDDLKNAIGEILPAHLAWELVFFYRTHAMLRPYTHGELAAFTHHQIREENLNEANG